MVLANVYTETVKKCQNDLTSLEGYGKKVEAMKGSKDQR